MSVEDAISAFDVSAYQSQLASTYEADADVTVVTLFKVKVSYSFSGSVTEAEVKPVIVEANNVDESRVTVTVASGRRLQSARRLQSTVSAEISTESQDELAGLKTSMETALEVDGETATAGTATVDVELVTTVVQSTAAAPPEPDAVGLFFPNIETTVDVGAAVISWTIMPCSDASMVCDSGRSKITAADSTGCGGSTCGASDQATCCASTGLAPGSNAETFSTPHLTLLIVLVFSFFAIN